MWHGGGLAEASAAFGGAPGDWLDLSTGINPHAWPCASEMAIDWQRLPDPAALAELERTAAHYFGVPPATVCAVPGTELALRLLGDIVSADAVHRSPGYGTHAVAIPGSTPVTDRDLAEAARRGRTILLGNPGNPDGRLLAVSALRNLAAKTDASGGWLIVDEAFADSDPAISIARLVDRYPRLIVLRSFGKFFGLPGLRLGFIVVRGAVLDRFKALLGSWPVSAAAIAIGREAYRDTAWSVAMRGRLPREAEALDAMLRRHGLSPRGACPLFRLIETDDAAALFERLARRLILTRPFDYDPRWLRIGLPGDAAALARLDAALANG
jgi:cobalamin biosynthetic protein CobC